MNQFLRKATAVLFLAFSFATTIIAQEMFSKKQLTEDVDFFFNTITKTHLNPTYYSKSIDSMHDQIITSLPQKQSKVNFKYDLMLQTNNLFDTHTGLSFGFQKHKIARESLVFPVNVELDGTNLIVNIENISFNIKKINTHSTGSLLKLFMKYCKADMSEVVRNEFIAKYFSNLFFNEFGDVDSFQIDIKEITSGRDTSIWLKSMQYNDFTQKYLSSGGKNFKLSVLNDSLAVLRINTFDNEKMSKIDSFLKESFLKIDSLKPMCLFIDIRSNGGGSDDCTHLLLDYLFNETYSLFYGASKRMDEERIYYSNIITWQRETQTKPNYLGKIIVLQSVETASAALTLSSLLKSSGRALIIGMPTTEPVHSFSESKIFKMPNTGIEFRCATGFFAMSGSKSSVNMGVIPDIKYKFQVGEITADEAVKIYQKAYEYYKGYFEFDSF